MPLELYFEYFYLRNLAIRGEPAVIEISDNFPFRQVEFSFLYIALRGFSGLVFRSMNEV